MKVCVLASGSRGNSIWVESSGTSVLFDAGISFRSITKSFRFLDEDPGEVQALVISHEHTDHINGAPVLCRKLELPVFANPGTGRRLSEMNGKMMIETFETGKSFRVGSLKITSFDVPHDAEEPVGFVVDDGSKRLGICTDLGAATRLVKERLKGCHALVLEANHDRDRLMDGPYPWHLKQRIRSRHGHLENRDTATLLSDVKHSGLEHVFLAHLSRTNNTPQQAFDCVAPVVSDIGTSVHLTWQNRISDKIEI